MIELYLPGYKVWGHAFPFSDVFVILFQGTQMDEIMQRLSADKVTAYLLVRIRTSSPSSYCARASGEKGTQVFYLSKAPIQKSKKEWSKISFLIWMY